jgi:O-antigen/teichoic acid export membrane protein
VAWTLTFSRGLLMAAAVWAAAGWIGEVMQMPLLASLLRVHAWALILQGTQSPMMFLWVKHLDLRKRVTVDVLRRGVEATVTITFALLYRTVWALVIGQLTALAIGCLLSFWMAPFRLRWSWRRSSVSYFLHFGKHLNVTTLCAFAVMTGGELVIGRLLGQEALGFYQVALAIPLLIGARATALMQQISVPTYATLQDDPRAVGRVFDLQMGIVGLVFLPVAVVIAATAPVIVLLFFGSQWLGIVDPLRLFCLYAVCAGYASVMASLHYGAGRPDLQMRSWAGQCVVYLVMIVPMTLHFGIMGAAISLTASYVVGVLLQGIGTYSLLGPSSSATFWALARMSLVTGVLAWMVVMMANIPNAVIWPWLMAAACSIGTALYGWYLWSVEVPRLRGLWKYRSQVLRAA